MPRLNQNQWIQALTMLARGDNVSNVRWAFGCHRNTIFGCASVSSKQVGRQIAVDRGVQTLERTGSLRWRTFDVVFNGDKFCKGSTVSADRQCCAASGKPSNPFGQGGPIWDKCLQHVIGLPVCSGHNDISAWGNSSGLGFYSLMSRGLTLVIMMVEFDFLEEDWLNGVLRRFNSISVISLRQLTLFMLSWVSPVLGWALKCLAQGHSNEKPRRSSAARTQDPWITS